jgi:hypothetical protein
LGHQDFISLRCELQQLLQLDLSLMRDAGAHETKHGMVLLGLSSVKGGSVRAEQPHGLAGVQIGHRGGLPCVSECVLHPLLKRINDRKHLAKFRMPTNGWRNTDSGSKADY